MLGLPSTCPTTLLWNYSCRMRAHRHSPMWSEEIYCKTKSLAHNSPAVCVTFWPPCTWIRFKPCVKIQRTYTTEMHLLREGMLEKISLPPLGCPPRRRWWCCFHSPSQPMQEGTWCWAARRLLMIGRGVGKDFTTLLCRIPRARRATCQTCFTSVSIKSYSTLTKARDESTGTCWSVKPTLRESLRWIKKKGKKRRGRLL